MGALSQATIFGGSIVNLIMNLKKFHPTRSHRPLTDFSTLLIFEPMLLVGTIIGVLLNVMFPDILILILLALVLSYATVRTSRKGVRLWKKETFELKKAEDGDDKTSNVEMQTVETKPNKVEISDDTDKEPDNAVVSDGKTRVLRIASDSVVDVDKNAENDENETDPNDVVIEHK